MHQPSTGSSFTISCCATKTKTKTTELYFDFSGDPKLSKDTRFTEYKSEKWSTRSWMFLNKKKIKAITYPCCDTVRRCRIRWLIAVTWLEARGTNWMFDGLTWQQTNNNDLLPSLCRCSGSVKRCFMDLCQFRSSGSHTCRNTSCHWATKAKHPLLLHRWQLQPSSIQ